MTNIQITITNADIDALSRIAQAEAANIENFISNEPGPWEESAAELAYGSVVDSILNRVASDAWYGHDIQGVINKRAWNGSQWIYQYTPLSETQTGTWEGLPPSSEAVRQAVISHIEGRLSGIPPIIGSATSYLNPTVPGTEQAWRSWAKNMTDKSFVGEYPFDEEGDIKPTAVGHIFGTPLNGDGSLGPRPHSYDLVWNGQTIHFDPDAPLDPEHKVPSTEDWYYFPDLPVVQTPEWVQGLVGSFGSAEVAGSPLVIDVDGDGVELSALGGPGTVFWDIDQDGFREASGWIAGGDGLLALDRNGNGIIDTQNELFGTLSTDGFAVLRPLDTNGDGVISAADAQFSDLRVWIDENSDGASAAGEIHTLSDLGIASISLNAVSTSYQIAGNDITHASTVTMADGSTRSIVDAWFGYDNVNSTFAGDYTLDVRTLFLPTLRGFGVLPDLHVAMSEDEGLLGKVQALATADAATILSPGFDLDGKIQAILLDWAGADSVVPGTRGPLFDAQKLAFLEAFMGEDYTRLGGSPDPAGGGAYFLKQAWAAAFNNLAAGVLVQTDLGRLLGEGASYNPLEGTVNGFSGLDLTVLDQFKALAAASGDADGAWRTMVRLLDYTVGIDDLSASDETALNAAIVETSPGQTLNGIEEILANMGINYIYGTGADETLNGTVGDDAIYGYGGNDTLLGHSGNDLLYADAGNDILVGGVGDDGLFGWTGADTYLYEYGFDAIQESYEDSAVVDKIVMRAGIDVSDVFMQRVNGDDLAILVAGVGSIVITDQLYLSDAYKVERLEFMPGAGGPIDLTLLGQKIEGTESADTLTGLDRSYFPEDILYGYGGDDRLSGGLGDDRLYGGYGDDSYVYSGGVDLIHDDGGVDKIVFDASFDPSLFSFQLVNPASPQDAQVFYDGVLVTKIEGQFGSRGSIETIEITGRGTITLSDILYVQTGTAGSDSLSGIQSGGSLDNTLSGLAGDDYLYGYEGNDTLAGGQGDDWVNGGTGDDVYIYNPGDGFDHINEGGGFDVIRLGSGITSSMVSFERPSEWTLRVLLNDLPAIEIQNFFYSYSDDPRVERLEFANGSVMDLSWYQNVIGTEGDDMLDGLDRSLLKADYVSGGGGNDTINGGAGDDRIDGGAGDDTINGGSGNDTINGDAGDDTIQGNAGDDIIKAGYGNDSLKGGSGDDRLEGGYGADTYYYSSGDGLDTIMDAGYATDLDTIRFGSGFDAASMNLVRVGRYDMAIEFAGDRKILIQNQFTTGGSIETARFTDGTNVDLSAWIHRVNGTSAGEILYGTDAGAGPDKIYGYGGNDTIYAYAGNDYLIGGDGDDLLDGGYGDDRYSYDSGVDTIYEVGGNDRIDLAAGITLSDLSFVRNGNYGLNLSINGSLAVRMDSQFSSENSGVEAIRFNDGSYFYLSSLQFTTEGTSGNDTLYGISYGANPDDTINGLGGNDTIYAGFGNDTINGGTGNDTLYGDAGNDVYLVNAGDGVDTISDSAGNDKIIFGAGFSASNMTMTRDGTNLNIAFGGILTTVIQNHFYNNGTYPLETLQFYDGSTINILSTTFTQTGTSAGEPLYGYAGKDRLIGNGGADTLYGWDGNDRLEGGADNDSLLGGTGNDTYVFGSGDGSDYLSEALNEGTDTVSLGFTPAQVLSWTDSSFLYLQSASNPADVLRISASMDYTPGNYGLDVGQRVESVSFSDGTSWNLTTGLILNDTDDAHTLRGSALSDTMDGNGGADTLYGWEGNDRLEGGAGNDNLFGGTGNDTYVFGSGDGSDYLYEALNEGTDTVSLGFTPAQVLSWTDSYYLYLQSASNPADVLRISGGMDYTAGNYGLDVGQRVESVNFSDGTSWNLTTGLILNDTDVAHALYGSALSDTMDGNGGADTLQGFDGDDILYGGNGADSLFGGTGDDRIYAENDNDYIYGDEGNDWLRGGSGNDTLYGGAGNDGLVGDAGVDILYGGAGADKFVFYPDAAFSEIDTIKDFSLAEGDRLFVRDLLIDFDPLTKLITDFVQISNSGSNSILSVDRDGSAGAYGMAQIATIQGVTGLTDESALLANGTLVAV